MRRLSEDEAGKFKLAEDGDYKLLKFNFASMTPNELTKVKSLSGNIPDDVPDVFRGAQYDDIHAYLMATDGHWELCEMYIVNLTDHSDMRRTLFSRMISAKLGMEMEGEGDTVHLFSE